MLKFGFRWFLPESHFSQLLAVRRGECGLGFVSINGGKKRWWHLIVFKRSVFSYSKPECISWNWWLWALITLCRLMVFKKKKEKKKKEKKRKIKQLQKWASVIVRHLVTYLFKLFILMWSCAVDKVYFVLLNVLYLWLTSTESVVCMYN